MNRTALIVLLTALTCSGQIGPLRKMTMRDPAFMRTNAAAGGGAGGIDWLTFTNGIFQFYHGGTHSSSNNGAELNVWIDRTPNGYNLTNNGAPYVTNSVINGHTAISFDGANDIFRTSTTIKRDQPKTIFIVLKQRSTSGTQTITDFDSGGSGNLQRIYVVADGGETDAHAGGGVPFAFGVTTDWHIITMVFNGASSVLRRNDGTENTTDPGSGSNGNGIFSLGCYGGLDSNPPVQFVNGWIACFISFDTALNSTDRDTVRNLINSRFAIY